MFTTRRGSTTLVGFQTHHGKIIFRGTRTQYSQERSTTTLPRPAIQTTAFSQLVAEATIRRSVEKLTTPTRAHHDPQREPHTSRHVYDVYYKVHVTSRHSHFNGRRANAPKSQAPSNGTYIMAMGTDMIRSFKITQYPGHGKSAGSLIAANPKGNS